LTFQKFCAIIIVRAALDRLPAEYFLGGVNVKIDDDKMQVPADVIQALARCLLPAIREFFDSAEGKREFAEWQAQQRTEQSAEPREEKQLREAS
jgi:hypothetical protein